MPPFWVIPAASGLAALICVGIGAVAVMREQRTLQAHTDALRAAGPTIADPEALENALSRIERSAEAMQTEIARAGAALRAIGEAARELRLREAMTALRVAGTALRALRSLF